MKKGKMLQLIAGLLSAAMLFTNESTACITYAGSYPPPTQNEIDMEEGTPEDTDAPETPENPDIPETPEDSDNPETSENPENPDAPKTPEDSDNPETPEDPDAPETPENPDIPETPENPDTPEIPDEPEDSENPDNPEAPAEEPTEEISLPAEDSISDNSAALNQIMAVEDAPVLEDFDIVDEGGNIIDADQTLYIQATDKRTLQVRLNPENAAGTVDWAVDNDRISITETGAITLKDPPITASVSGTVTARIIVDETTTITKTCKVEFVPPITGIQIVDQTGAAIPAEGITIQSGQQKRLDIKLLPEGTAANIMPNWHSDKYLQVRNGIVTVRSAPNEFPYKCTIEAYVNVPGTGRITASCPVTITQAPDGDGILCGDILFTGEGLGTYRKLESPANTWEANITQKSTAALSYQGTETDYTIYYTNNLRGITFKNSRIVASQYKQGSSIKLSDKYPLQIVLAKGDRKSETYSDIYTINLKAYDATFAISPTAINNVPGGADQTITVTNLPALPEGQTQTVTWFSGDEKLVSIKNGTSEGATLAFGQRTGRTQITAVAKNHKGEDVYAVCNVRVSMTLPLPVFASADGGETESTIYETEDDYRIVDNWLIDKGGKVTLSIRGLEKAQIYYTTNNSDPTKSGKLYQEPITINATTTIKAYARMEGYNDSEVAESKFTIGNPKLTLPKTLTIGQNESEKTISVTLPDGATADASTPSWTTSDPEIAEAATESDYNEATDKTTYRYVVTRGSEAGKCTITASATDYAGRTQTASCEVTVVGALGITPEVTLEEGGEASVKITKIPSGYKKTDVTWTADDSVLTVTATTDGAKITAGQLKNTAAPNVVTLKASLAMGEETVSARCQVTVTPKQFTVNFHGWQDKIAKKQLVNRGQDAAPPTDAEMSAAAPKGYQFAGWNANESAWKNITKDTDIFAKPYTLKEFTITYENLKDADGKTLGTNAGGNPLKYTVETAQSALTLQDAKPIDSAAKKFVGWYLEADFSGSPIDEIPGWMAEDITLYAKWSSAKTGLCIELGEAAAGTSITAYAYTGKAVKPVVRVYDGEKLLTEKTDYTVSYKNNTKAFAVTEGMAEAELKKAPTVTVKGKGNYDKSVTATFTITPQSLSSDQDTIDAPALYLAYNNGRKLSVVPTVTWNGKKLKNNTDFEIKSIVKQGTSKNLLTEGCTDEGNYDVTVSGKGNFSGTRDISLTVTTKTLLSKVSVKGKMKDMVWSGQTLEESGFRPDADITLKKGPDDLKKDTDYTVTFDKTAKDVGVYTITFTGIGETYAGTVQKTFQITGMPLKASNLDFGGGWQTKLVYNGTAQTQTFSLSYKKDSKTKLPMTLDQDYTIAYENHTNVGKKAAVIITGKGGYTGTVKKTFQITADALGNQDKTPIAAKVTVSLANGTGTAPYEKGGAKPKLTVTYNGNPLTEGTDYTVSYKNNRKLADTADPKKAPTATVKGKGNFKDSVEYRFAIEAQDISQLSIAAEDVMAAAPNAKKNETIGMTGAGKYKSTPKITDHNGKALSAGTDFEKTYTFTDENGVVLGAKDQVPAGSVLTVTVKGCNNYTGETKVSYRVLAAKMSLKSASVSLKKGVIKYYDLEPVTLKKEELVVKLNGKELEPENYVIVSYANNRKKGTAKITIKGVGEYGGSKTVNFAIKSQVLTWFKKP